ncbi:MAG: 16S rRNA (cytidine(1402)-2'-O)-methyltransferase [Candidatus Marinimicrobia bacterium]|nr:16S rRNA (cytidine(1402)-2'-O)-methyltransferase [Candidatus Neomarinimicrobiota bacterium]
MNTSEKGTLYIVATPIGNLQDMTFRAIEILKNVDILACEDTRKTGILLKHFEIQAKKLVSYYSHNENQRIPELLRALNEGLDVAQVSDAGTPGISDPGNRLITAVAKEDIRIIPIPGAAALTTLLSVCHFPARSFHFEGFLPTKKGRQTRLKILAEKEEAIILYESTHRIMKLLQQILDYFGDRECLVGRELTKMHETHFRGRISEALDFFENHSIKGEFTLIVRQSDS